MKRLLFTVLMCWLFVSNSNATIWEVGATKTYTKPSQVRTLVQDGDTVYIDGGVYLNDATKWGKKNLKIIGLGTGTNRTILRFSGEIPNGKGIFVFESPGASDNAYVENIVFDGARVAEPSGNGAGIRFQAVNLTVVNCKFMNCQNGILEGHGSVSTSNVLIHDSEFYNNGYHLENPTNGHIQGQEHHIYIGQSTDTLEVMNCYFHKPRGQGNTIKTRAQRSFILYNLIDEEDGNGSWEIHLAQGGYNVIMGNVIIQGTSSSNRGIIGYENTQNALQDLYVVNNTIINKYPGIIRFVHTFPSTGINTFKVYNNIFASVTNSTNTVISGQIPSVLDTSNNVFALDYATLGFTNPASNDFSLTATSIRMIDKGTNAGNTNVGYALNPTKSYVSNTSPLMARSISGGTIDIGAYEYIDPTSAVNKEALNELGILVYPNPAQNILNIEVKEDNSNLTIFDLSGRQIFTQTNLEKKTQLDCSTFSNGIYLVQVKKDKSISTQKIVINR